MAFTRMNTKQHHQGSKLEDFIYHKLKSQGFEVYRQIETKNKFLLPNEIIKYLPSTLISIMEHYPFDFFLIKENKVYVVEVKSKSLKYSKDDRKLDISLTQFNMFKNIEKEGINVKILVLWFSNNKYHYKFFNFKDLKVIGKEKA